MDSYFVSNSVKSTYLQLFWMNSLHLLCDTERIVMSKIGLALAFVQFMSNGTRLQVIESMKEQSALLL